MEKNVIWSTVFNKQKNTFHHLIVARQERLEEENRLKYFIKRCIADVDLLICVYLFLCEAYFLSEMAFSEGPESDGANGIFKLFLKIVKFF